MLAIGLTYWVSIPAIEQHGSRIRLLTAIVFIGGLGRLAAVAMTGLPSGTMCAALAMELVVTPAIALWQRKIEQHNQAAAALQPICKSRAK